MLPIKTLKEVFVLKKLEKHHSFVQSHFYDKIDELKNEYFNVFAILCGTYVILIWYFQALAKFFVDV